MNIKEIYDCLSLQIPKEIKLIIDDIERNKGSIHNLLCKNRDFNYHLKNSDLSPVIKKIFSSKNLFLSIEMQKVTLFFNINEMKLHVDLNNSSLFFTISNKLNNVLYCTLLDKNSLCLYEYHGFDNLDNTILRIKDYPLIVESRSSSIEDKEYIKNLNNLFSLLLSKQYTKDEIKDFMQLNFDLNEKSKEYYFLNHQIIINKLLNKKTIQNKLKP